MQKHKVNDVVYEVDPYHDNRINNHNNNFGRKNPYLQNQPVVYADHNGNNNNNNMRPLRYLAQPPQQQQQQRGRPYRDF